jgi:hypothetical protein
MISAQIITQWAGAGTETSPNHPKLADDYALTSWTDVTGTPSQNLKPTPNVLVVEVLASEAVFQNILNDPNYGQGAVLWQESQ